MIALIITAALLALFTSTFIVFLSACLSFFDYVIKGIKGLFKAVKVMILKKNGKVHYGTMYQQNGNTVLVEPNTTTEKIVDFGELDDSIKNAFNRAEFMNNGTKMVTTEMDEEVENEIKNQVNH